MVMRALDRKVLRDLGGMWAQALAIALVIGAGVAMFVMSEGMLKSLFETRAAYYERYGFAHVFAPLKRAPNALAAEHETIPGVRAAETRIRRFVTLDMPTIPQPVQGEVLSYPAGAEPQLNRLHLTEGRWLSSGLMVRAMSIFLLAVATIWFTETALMYWEVAVGSTLAGFRLTMEGAG